MLNMEVVDMLPVGDDGTGHLPGCECPCAPDTLTDGTGRFICYHNTFHERML